MPTVWKSKLWKSLSPSERESLNVRIEAGEGGPELLPWLNGLMAKKGKPEDINAENLSQWTKGPYQEWSEHRDHLDVVRQISARCSDIAAASGGKILPGLNDMVGGMLFSLAQVIQETPMTVPDAEADAEAVSFGAETLMQLGATVAKMQQAQQKEKALDLLERGVAQKDRAMELAEKAFDAKLEAMRLTSVKQFMKWHESPEVAAILRSKVPEDRKMDQLGDLLFGADIMDAIRGKKPEAAPQ